MQTEQIAYNHDAHARAYYDQPCGTLGKFEGERRAVEVAYVVSLNGFYHDAFGTVDDGYGYYCRVLFDDAPFIVCFVEDAQGFVREISNSEYEAAHAQFVEFSEDEDEQEDYD